MKKHTDWIKEMSWTEFRDRKATCDTVIIPGGAIEVYGPHLPLGTDSLVSWKMCELLAERTGAMIGPTIEAGESDVLFNFPGTVRIRPHTYELVMRDIIESMIKWGFKNFLFLNMHAGNVPIITQLCREYQRSAGIKCAQIDWWRFTQPNTRDICEYSGWMAHGHASECGTSLMLYCGRSWWMRPSSTASSWIPSSAAIRTSSPTTPSRTRPPAASWAMPPPPAGRKARRSSTPAWTGWSSS